MFYPEFNQTRQEEKLEGSWLYNIKAFYFRNGLESAFPKRGKELLPWQQVLVSLGAAVGWLVVLESGEPEQ